MIKSSEIESKAKQFGLTPAEVEKDYVYGWLLNGIYSQSNLGSILTLKGGSALRKAYLPNTRFSKDLDFSTESQIGQNVLMKELNSICKYIENKTGVQFRTQDTKIKTKELGIPDVNALEARIYFRGFYKEESFPLKAQLDVTQFEKLYLGTLSRPLFHPYSDSDICQVNLKCQKIEEILASKLTTLLHRRRAGDLFDLLYAIIFSNEYNLQKKEVITTFLKKSIFSPADGKNSLLAVPLEEYRPLWSTIIAPVQSLFDFNYAMSNFNELVSSMFGLLVPSPSFASAGGFVGGGGFGFNSAVRNIIIQSGQNKTMVEIKYDGYTRYVEPYKLEYYVRKKDGKGSEYFWGYDTTGGKNGRKSIKMFFCDQIEYAGITNHSFVPQFPIEL